MPILDLDSSLRLDKDATNIALGYKQGESPQAKIIAPNIDVAWSGQYPSYAKDAFLANDQDDVRAPGQKKPIETIWPVETWHDYICEEHTRTAYIDRQRKGREGVVAKMVYSDPVTAVKKVREMMNQRLTYLIAYAVKNMSASYYTVPGVKWNDDGAEPFEDLQAAIRQFKKNCGFNPNKILIPSHIMTYLGDKVRAQYSVTAAVSNKNIFKELAMPDLELSSDGLLVDETPVYDGTDFGSVWGDNVVLARVVPDPAEWEPTFMGTLVPKDKQPVQVFSPYETEHKTGWEIQIVMEYKVVILDNYAGYMLKSVLS